MSNLAIQSVTAFLTTLAIIVPLAKIGPHFGLTDAPSKRKLHDGDVPTVGGIAIFATLVLGASLWSSDASSLVLVKGEDALWVLLACAGFLVLTGALDDRFELGILIRIGSEVVVALLVIEILGLRLTYLGDLLGIGQIRLDPLFAYVFTIVAIFGLVNAFNMLDGIDGLLASLVLSTLVVFHFLTQIEPGLISLVIGSSLLAFLISNLGISKVIPKTFLGDAGSRLLGFLVVCMLVGVASGQLGNGKVIKPVTALFLVAIPLFDMVFTTLRRVIRQKSPFSADRTHIHHLMQEMGFSDRRALVLILAISISLNCLGLILHLSRVAEYYQFLIFLGCFALYSFVMSQVWLITDQLRMERAGQISVDK